VVSPADEGSAARPARPGRGGRAAPDRGDVVWITLDPQVGHEQRGRRPALVLSPRAYNARVGLGLFCPITSQVKGYPFEVRIPPGLAVTGVVLADQVKSFDWRARHADFVTSVPEAVATEVLGRLQTLLSGSPNARSTAPQEG
jgi:mRNA interferase MazF